MCERRGKKGGKVVQSVQERARVRACVCLRERETTKTVIETIVVESMRERVGVCV